MIEWGTDRYGAEYRRTSNDFHFRLLEQDNCVCSICHGTGAKVEFRYVTRNYESARRKGKICDTLQAHEHGFWICPVCVDNLVKKSQGLVKDLVKASPTGAEGSDEDYVGSEQSHPMRDLGGSEENGKEVRKYGLQMRGQGMGRHQEQ